jgi:heavy metal sensor kinase
MKPLTIQRKLTIWYAGTIALLMLLFFLILYLTLSPALSFRTSNMLTEKADDIADEVERKRGAIVLDDDVSINSRLWYTVFDLDGAPALSNHPESWLDALPEQSGSPYTMIHEESRWMIYDTNVKDDGVWIARLRIATQMDSFDEATGELWLLFLLLMPVIGGLSVLMGTLIARRALQPVDTITATAREIGRGDLTKRLNFQNTNDEIGRLAETFDEMLDYMEEAMKREKQFTSDAAHELRTPLSVIMAQAQEALGQPESDTEEYRVAMDAIYEKSRSMQAMLSQMLMISRGFEQAKVMELDVLRLDQIAMDIAEEMTPVAHEKDISIKLDLDEEVHIKGDLLLITRMLMNLLDNALKYGKAGGWIQITVSSQNNAAQLVVADNGIGIAEEHLPHIFRRFYRTNASRTGKGAGLGLSLVEWIVKLHHGSVAVDSEVGKGTVFTIAIPCTVESE